MLPRSVTHSTFVIERRHRHPLPKASSAPWLTPLAKRRWFAEGEHHQVEEFHMEFRAGGSERMRSRFKEGSPFPGLC
jgi:uncharacterized protein YndB with AHSA1/START domain